VAESETFSSKTSIGLLLPMLTCEPVAEAFEGRAAWTHSDCLRTVVGKVDANVAELDMPEKGMYVSVAVGWTIDRPEALLDLLGRPGRLVPCWHRVFG
jgi:hypothetical protein